MMAVLVDILAFLDSHGGAVTAAATIFIAIFTTVLAFVTGRQAKLTKTLAYAAKTSAEATPKVERAYIFFHPLSDNFSLALFSDVAKRYYRGDNTAAVPPTPEVKIRLSNGGRTAAALVEIRHGLTHSGNPPQNTGYGSFATIQLRVPMISAGGYQEFDPVCKDALTNAEFAKFEGNTHWFFVQGQVLYRTVFDGPGDKPRQTTFCWRYAASDRAWVEWGGDEYNSRT